MQLHTINVAHFTEVEDTKSDNKTQNDNKINK